MPDAALDLAALDALAQKATPHRLDQWQASRTGAQVMFRSLAPLKDARDARGIIDFHAAVSPEVVRRMIWALSQMAGLISTMPQYSNKHPQEVLELFLAGITDAHLGTVHTALPSPQSGKRKEATP